MPGRHYYFRLFMSKCQFCSENSNFQKKNLSLFVIFVVSFHLQHLSSVWVLWPSFFWSSFIIVQHLPHKGQAHSYYNS
ncbi:hypothetical protein ES288_D04G062400v1 [Gossypium darwinii]|uniref:Uncharacterized protein n=1 Tax=Gossypium darwinii TaxID=34276 RepID=A0A5D2CWC5_GOSDA|nr:hypothetical protein ES288_D04G062400v1 [Gossypium darwinii]